MLDPELQPERERVAAAARRLATEGLVLGTAGNMSHRTAGAVLVTPTGGVLATLEAADVAAGEIDGRPPPRQSRSAAALCPNRPSRRRRSPSTWGRSSATARAPCSTRIRRRRQ